MPASDQTAAAARATTSTADLRALSQLLDQALQLPASRIEPWLAALPDAARHLAPRLRGVMHQHRTGACAQFLASSPRLNGAPTESPVQAGHRAGPYTLLREIGRGGMCSVWLAERADVVEASETADGAEAAAAAEGRCRPARQPRLVAIKLPHRALDADTTRRMARERDITALMHHPQVARLRAAGVDADQRPYLVLNPVHGLPLDQWCKPDPTRRPTRPQARLQTRLRLAVQLARALAYVHSRGVVHRDLKPANVTVSSRGRVHLLDFGIARRLPGAQQPDDASGNELSFTPAYASPEQRRGEPTTTASDVYSLGVLLFELFTGHLPHGPLTPVMPAEPMAVDRPRYPARGWLLGPGLLDRGATPPLASQCAPDAATAARLRGAIDALLYQALALSPDQRPVSAAAMADLLEAALQASQRGGNKAAGQGQRQPSEHQPFERQAFADPAKAVCGLSGSAQPQRLIQ